MIRRYIVLLHDAVNDYFPASDRRSDSPASTSPPRTGRAFGGGVTGNSRDGSVAHFQSSRTAKTSRSGDRSAGWQESVLRFERFLAQRGARTRAGTGANDGARNSGNDPRSHCPQAGAAQAPGQSTRIFRRVGG